MRHSMLGRFIAPRPTQPQIQAFFAVNAAHALEIIRPAFASQEHMNSDDAVAHASGSDLFDALPDWQIVSAMRLVISQRARQQADAAGAAQRHTVLIDQFPY